MVSGPAWVPYLGEFWCRAGFNNKEVLLKWNTYGLIQRAVEEGITYGLSRAHKHTDVPTQADLSIAIENAIMSELSSIIDFSGDDPIDVVVTPEEEALIEAQIVAAEEEVAKKCGCEVCQCKRLKDEP